MKQVIVNKEAIITSGKRKGQKGLVVGYDSESDVVDIEIQEPVIVNAKSEHIDQAEQPKSIKPWTLVMSFFEIGKTYKIKFTDSEGNVVEYKCMVIETNGGNLGVQVFETDGEPDKGQTWINWKWIDRIEEVKGEWER